MARALGVAAPVAALLAGVAALALWVSGVSLRWLDGGVGALFVAGVILAAAAWARGSDERTRRVAIIAFGWNAFGLLALVLAYATG